MPFFDIRFADMYRFNKSYITKISFEGNEMNTKVRSYSGTDRDNAMLEAVAHYHGMNKSATIASLVRKEFWRVFPGGSGRIKPDRGARVESK